MNKVNYFDNAINYSWNLECLNLQPVYANLLNLTCKLIDMQETKVIMKFYCLTESLFFKALSVVEAIKQNPVQIVTPEETINLHLDFKSKQFIVEDSNLIATIVFDLIEQEINPVDSNSLKSVTMSDIRNISELIRVEVPVKKKNPKDVLDLGIY